jgi:DNA-binding LytR/AlgR family response regulator
MVLSQKKRILVIEDDPVWSLFIESAIAESGFVVIGSANTVMKAKSLIDGYKPDILVADIMLKDTDIFSIMDDEKYHSIPKVFMTSHTTDEVFLRSKQIPRSTYLAKPFHKFSLLAALDLLNLTYPTNSPVEEKFIEVRGRNHQKIKILFGSIVWISAEGNYSFIHTKEKQKFAIKRSLIRIKKDLDDNFFQINKSHIINKNYIQRIDLGNQVVNVYESAIAIGRAYRKELDVFLEQKL